MERSPSSRLFLSLSAALLMLALAAAVGASWLRWARQRATAPDPVATPALAAALATSVPALVVTGAPATTAAPPSKTPTAPPPTPAAAPETYLIQPGDTLTALAARFGVSVEALMALNGLADANAIVAGSELRLPGAGPAATTPADAAPAATSTTGLQPPTALPATPVAPGARTLGVSSGGRAIEHYVFGDGPAQVAFVGAIHGGYEWNSGNLAYEMVTYFQGNPGAVPDAVTLHIIPVANPDGMARVARGWTSGPIDPPTGDIADTEPGRFNDRDIDLNRNWDCNWQPTALWRDQPVDAGDAPFSENETAVLRDFFLAQEMRAVVFWHSAAGVVLPGRCGEDAHAPSVTLARVYSAASGYPLQQGGLGYEISGDASDWLTTQGIPSIAIELTDHTAIEWARNLDGTLAVLNAVAASCAAGGCEPPSDR